MELSAARTAVEPNPFALLPVELIREIFDQLSLEITFRVLLSNCWNHATCFPLQFIRDLSLDTSYFRRRTPKNKFLSSGLRRLTHLERLSISNTHLSSTFFQEYLPKRLAHLRVLALRDVGVSMPRRELAELLIANGAAASLQEVDFLNTHNAQGCFLDTPICDSEAFPRLIRLRCIPAARSPFGGISTNGLAQRLKNLVEVSVEVWSQIELAHFKGLVNLRRLTIKATLKNPVFNIFELDDKDKTGYNWKMRVDQTLAKFAAFSPPLLRPHNVLLRQARSEYNLLMRAAMLRHFPFAKALLEAIPDWNTNVQDSLTGRTALHYSLDKSSKPEDVNIIRLLLQHGASPFMVDRKARQNCLVASLLNHDLKLSELLLAKALEIEPSSQSWVFGCPPDSGRSALCTVLRECNYEAAEWLLHLYESGRVTDLAFRSLNAHTRLQRPALHMILQHDPTRCFDWLRRFPKEFDLAQRDSTGRSFVHLCLAPIFHNNLLDRLLEMCPEIQLDDTDFKGWTGLHYAFAFGPDHSVQYFLNNRNFASRFLISAFKDASKSLMFCYSHTAPAFALSRAVAWAIADRKEYLYPSLFELCLQDRFNNGNVITLANHMPDEMIHDFGQYHVNILVVAALLCQGSSVLLTLLSNTDLLAKIDINATFPVVRVLPRFEAYFSNIGDRINDESMTCLAEICLLMDETHSLVTKLFILGCNFLSTCGRANNETVYERAVRSNLVARRTVTTLTSLLEDSFGHITHSRIRSLIEKMAQQVVT